MYPDYDEIAIQGALMKLAQEEMEGCLKKIKGV